MAAEVKLPRLGQGMESGTIVKWLKAEGDQVERGEPLYELDTDKVTQEVEAEASGVLLKITVSSGEVSVGQTIAVIGEPGEQAPEQGGDGAAATVEREEREQEKGSGGADRGQEVAPGREAPTAEQIRQLRPAEAGRAEEPGGNGAGRIKASPLARRIARERGIELRSLRGTGPEGRVVAQDVERAAAGAPAAAGERTAAGEVERQELSSLRRTIARRLTEAWQAPAFQLVSSAEMTRAQELLELLVARRQEGEPKPTVTDLLTKACAAGLMRHPAVNALWAEDAIELHPWANIGIAVAIPAGLVVPVIHEADRKTVAELAAARVDIVSRARENKLRQADLEGGTFTISNLGMYGVEQFVAVLNPPQAAILAVGAIEQRAVPAGDGFEARPLLTLTLTCDHRSLDGATAAEFLRTLKSLLEEPGLML